VLAKQIATLDRLSDGRMLVGLGLGISRAEFLAVRPEGTKAHRGNMLDETIEALRLLLAHRKEKASYAGTYNKFSGVSLDPKPLQDPIPIYVPGKVGESFERVARFGLGIMVQASMVQSRIEALKPVLERHGRTISDIDLIAEGQIRLSSSRERAAADYAASRQGRFFVGRGASLEKLLADNWIGTPDEVVEKIATVAEHGVTHFNALHIAGDTMSERLEQMQMFAELVMPRLGA
jgi:alkanesulfonate monooxygenase SsuD/methylene tetrahydromethanopterin reductase-like flavin-dependent oxidoreductase (luciferase family)